MYCVKCGTLNPYEAKFCRSCGTPIQMHSQKETSSVSKGRYLSGLALLVIEFIFIGLCLEVSREMNPDSDGVFLNVFYLLLSCVVYPVLCWLKKRLSIKSANFQFSTLFVLFIINTLLLPIWNGSLVSSYLIMSIGLSVNSLWAWIRR